MAFKEPLTLSGTAAVFLWGFSPLYSGDVLPLDCAQEFDPIHDAEFFAALPSRAGVFLLETADGNARPYLARTADIRRASERLLRPPEALSKRLNLRSVAKRIHYRMTGSKFEQGLTLYHHAVRIFPQRYREVLRLRPPAILKLNLRNDYPRFYVTRRIRADEGLYFGPFASRRMAESFADAFLDFFKIRRCQIKIRRDPEFPGCIYSEMKMCLAPCFAGCSKQEYDGEVGRVLETLESRGAWLIREIERDRELASADLDFERAAAFHKRLEKVSGVLHELPALVRRVESLDAVILQRAAEDQAIAVFPILDGLLREPIFLRFAELSLQPRSVENLLREQLRAITGDDEHPPGQPPIAETSGPDSGDATSQGTQPRARRGIQQTPAELEEHLSIVARWYYSKPREGEILFRETDWPYRRILRACGRLLAPPASGNENGTSER